LAKKLVVRVKLCTNVVAIRTVQVRVERPIPMAKSRPACLGTGLTVPTSAVIRIGEQETAFHAVSTDRFVQVRVKISPLRFDLDGLKTGDQVVTCVSFLPAESDLTS
jgi:Cu(I)/Ag(I) efflux system membrane fusion protein